MEIECVEAAKTCRTWCLEEKESKNNVISETFGRTHKKVEQKQQVQIYFLFFRWYHEVVKQQVCNLYQLGVQLFTFWPPTRGYLCGSAQRLRQVGKRELPGRCGEWSGLRSHAEWVTLKKCFTSVVTFAF